MDDPHSPNLNPIANDLEETESDSEFDLGKDKTEWDPHARTRSSPLDGEASDENWDIGDDSEGEAFNLRMLQMFSDLQDDDLRDQEWKPVHQQKKRKTKPGKFGIAC